MNGKKKIFVNNKNHEKWENEREKKIDIPENLIPYNIWDIATVIKNE